MNDTCAHYPYFMQTPWWGKKNLNTALASWAELKHDAILYAKQPMEAECGDGGPEPPVVKGYIEPNLKFWNKALELLRNTVGVYKKYGLENEKVKVSTDSIVNAGADILVCHHTHTLQTIETYRGHPIYYSIGNFIFDQRKPINVPACLVQIDLTPTDAAVKTIPIRSGVRAYIDHSTTTTQR